MKAYQINVMTGEKTLRDFTDKEKKSFIDNLPTDSDKLNVLRESRNILLKETDWTQSRDVTLSNDADWKTYRQKLRDITKTFKSMNDDGFSFPTKPTE